MSLEHVSRPEPEVKVLGNLAGIALFALRALLFAVGAAAIGGAIYTLFDPILVYSKPENVPPLAERIATNTTFVCFGLPLLLPHRWTFGRGRLAMLALAVLLVAGPMPFESNPLHCLGRLLACCVGCAPILVWRTLWALRD